MEKINTHTFENGLHLIHIEKKDFIKSFAAVSVNFGAKDLYFDQFNLPSGVAHFLEHKMFELENGDYIEKFETLGASVNAYTSFKETVYYFSTVQKINEPLHLLLDLVSDLQITTESIEKEKAIIIQELNMYLTNPDYKFFNYFLKNMYYNNPIKFDIGGDSNSVSATTKQDLEISFAKFYAPNNLVLTITSSTPFDEIKKMVENHSIILKKAAQLPMQTLLSEPETVVKKEDTLTLTMEKDKVAYGLKLVPISDYEQCKKMELSVKFLSEMVLSALNPQYQTWIEEQKVSEYSEYYIDFSDTYAMFLLFNEGEDVDFLKTILNHIVTLELKEELLQQLKKRYYSSSVRIFDSFEASSLLAARNYFVGKNITYDTDLIKAITLADLENAQNYLKQHHDLVLYGKRAV